LESAREINSRVDGLLRAAEADGSLPTAVEDLVRAAELAEADDYVLDESFIKRASAYLRGLLRTAKQNVQGLVDRRARIVHVSPTIENDGKKRFVKMHETVHHILPHQQDMLYAEDHEMLQGTTSRLFERGRIRAQRSCCSSASTFRGMWPTSRYRRRPWHCLPPLRILVPRSIPSPCRVTSRHGDGVVLERTPRSSSPPTWRRE